MKILRQALPNIPEGNVHEAVPRRVKLPKGEMYGRTEAPKGELGFYIVSDGGGQAYPLQGARAHASRTCRRWTISAAAYSSRTSS